MLLSNFVARQATSGGRCAASSFSAFYTTLTGLAAVRNWRVTSPAPISLVSDAIEQQQQPMHKPTRASPGSSPGASRVPTPPQHRLHKEKIKTQFPDGWSPPRKLSRQAMDGMRAMHAQHPELFTTPVLAEKFKISPEAVRRVLKSKWEPTKAQRERLLQREERERREHIRQRKLEEVKAQLEVQGARTVAKRRQNDTLTLT
ncbi:hypothetical protein BC835DRAFT_392084 [Cytidiella melzeri]|nr:hypothetical protein BC835DRAFT_392084 [Cytidiella melzeri]